MSQQGSTSVSLPPDETRAPGILAGLWGPCVAAWIIITLRLYVRLWAWRNAGWDDLLIVISLLLATLSTVFETVSTIYGFGRHAVYVAQTPSNLMTIQKMTLGSAIENTVGTTLVKVSVSIFVLRIIQRTHKPVRYILYAQLAVMISTTIATFFTMVAQCRPLAKYWDPTTPGHCIDPNAVNILLKVNNGICAATDFVTVFAPSWVVYHLQMPRWKKISCWIILGAGLFSAGASIVKTRYIIWTPPDPTWDFANVVIWSSLEHQLGLVIASLPCLGQLVTRARSRNDSAGHGEATFASLGRRLRSIRPWSMKWKGHRDYSSSAEGALPMTRLETHKDTIVMVATKPALELRDAQYGHEFSERFMRDD